MSVQLAFDVVALLLALTAAFAYINYRLIHLPPQIGLVILALLTSLALLALDRLVPGLGLRRAMHGLLAQVDFAHALMNGALSFLLFAAALQVDLDEFLKWKWTVVTLATAGVALSTLLIGLGMWQLFALPGAAVPLVQCLLFGALISPTDPVAVFGLLRGVNVPPGLQAIFGGESLFNDGMAIVLFSILVAAVSGNPAAALDPWHGLASFVREAGGAVALGAATGYVAFAAIRGIDEYTIELMISLALVMVTYAVAQQIGVSGPVAVAVAGVITGTQGTRYAMSERTRDALRGFWRFVDETLNAILFLLIGFEVIAIQFEAKALTAAALAIPVALAARLVSVALPALPLNLSSPRKWRGVALLTWGGLRGGVSIALALSLPAMPVGQLLVTACYAIVVFTIVVQGLTMRPLARRLFPRDRPGSGGAAGAAIT